jgi:biopolymer transport protein ExbB
MKLASLIWLAAPAADLGTLPRDLTAWGMFVDADWIVRTVIVSLALASVTTWTVLVAKTLELRSARRREEAVLEILARASSLEAAAKDVDALVATGGALVAAAQEEVLLSADALADRDGLKERIALRLERVEAAARAQATRGTGVLATIGAIAPFVGLFGTVWGIMDSFIGISLAKTTNLAVVAPGIAEALLATAAVVVYNYFARRITAHVERVRDLSSAVLRLVSRDLSRRGGA